MVKIYKYLKRLAMMSMGVVITTQGAIQVTDSSGKLVTLSTPARRIVSLAPHLTELLYAAGGGDYVVGVADYSDYPPSARGLPIVSGAGKVDVEHVLALRPDLVVAWDSGISTTQMERLRRVGLTIYMSEPRALTDIAVELEHLGRLVGSETIATTTATTFLANLERLRVHYAHQSPVRIFYQIWDHPLITVGAQHLISRVMELCGGRNIFPEDSGLAPIISREAVLAADPEVIVASGSDARRPVWLNNWRTWPQLTAVTRDNLFNIPPDFIQRHTPRILQGIELLCSALEQARKKR